MALPENNGVNENTSTGVAIKTKKPDPLTEEQIKAAQELQSRIASGNMVLTPEEQQAQGAAKIAEQLAINRGEASQVTPKVETPQVVTSQEQLADKLQNQFGTNNGNQAVNTDVSIQTERKPVYLGDYSNSPDLLEIARKANVPVQDVFADYQRWGRDTGNPTDFLRILNASQKGDISKTPQENEAEEKRRVGQERMEKFANFLKHLGNFVGAAGWGGSVQGLEHPKELTARQQAIRDKTEALRTAYNKNYFENYYKQRAEELKQQNQNRLERQYDLMVRKQDWKEKYDTGILDAKKEALRLKEDYNSKLISLREYEDGIKMINALAGQQRANTADYNAHKVVKTEETKDDGYGNKTTVVKVSTPGRGSASGSNKQSNSGNSKDVSHIFNKK